MLAASMAQAISACNISSNAVAKLLIDAELACSRFHDEMIRNVSGDRRLVRRDLVIPLCKAEGRLKVALDLARNA